jgi:hypothetical protein
MVGDEEPKSVVGQLQGQHPYHVGAMKHARRTSALRNQVSTSLQKAIGYFPEIKLTEIMYWVGDGHRVLGEDFRLVGWEGDLALLGRSENRAPELPWRMNVAKLDVCRRKGPGLRTDDD